MFRTRSALSEMTGTSMTGQLSLEMKARDLNDFPLVRRGFHWINEVPNNR